MQFSSLLLFDSFFYAPVYLQCNAIPLLLLLLLLKSSFAQLQRQSINKQHSDCDWGCDSDADAAHKIQFR